MGPNKVSKQATVSIEKLGAQGDGIGAIEGTPVFVPMTVPGDVVKVSISKQSRSSIHADLVQILEPSDQRREPPCIHYGKCGGCSLQHFNTGLYQSWSADRIGMALRQHRFEDVTIEKAIMSPPNSRRRVALKAIRSGANVTVGFNAKNSHQIVNVSECEVASKAIVDLLQPLKAVLKPILPPRMLATLHITETYSGLDVLVDAAVDLSLEARESLVEFANVNCVAALHWQQDGFLDPVIIRAEPVMAFAGVKVPVKPAAFTQATKAGEQALIDLVLAECEGYGRVADLFCGVGTFTFPLARHHQVLAVEGAQDALKSLESGRNRAQREGIGLKQIILKHRDLFRRPITVKEFAGFEAVVFDPPRAGAEAQVKELAQSSVKRIVAVSCNPNTFARDARILADGGYSLDRVTPVDQFLWSPHMELVACFSKVG
jgi:23S rRNA (uracil1939-C5)-methyltransferase